MRPVWSFPLADDSDVTPTLDFRNGTLALYTGTEIDWQKDIVGNYLGDAYVYRFDPLTGKVVWRTSVPCWTKNAANVGDDINGGCLGSPVVGKKKMADLVVFSFAMTNGIYSGNQLVAFQKETGAIAWTYKMNYYSWSSPVDLYDADGNPYLVVCDSIGQIHLVDGLTGERLFFLQTVKHAGTEDEQGAGNIESSPAVFGNQLVVGTRGNVIVGVTLK
jgi:outer membrane protein assembly factor BamB